MAKVQFNVSCSCCSKIDQNEIELNKIFDALLKTFPSTKGPIESIYAIFEKEKQKKQKRQMLTA